MVAAVGREACDDLDACSVDHNYCVRKKGTIHIPPQESETTIHAAMNNPYITLRCSDKRIHMVGTVNKMSSRGCREVASEFQNPDCCCYRSTLLRHLVTKWQCSNCVVHGLCGSCSSTDLFLDCVWLVNLLGKLHS